MSSSMIHYSAWKKRSLFWEDAESSSRHIKGILNLFIHFFKTLFKILVYIILKFYIGMKKNDIDLTILFLIIWYCLFVRFKLGGLTDE